MAKVRTKAQTTRALLLYDKSSVVISCFSRNLSHTSSAKCFLSELLFMNRESCESSDADHLCALRDCSNSPCAVGTKVFHRESSQSDLKLRSPRRSYKFSAVKPFNSRSKAPQRQADRAARNQLKMIEFPKVHFTHSLSFVKLDFQSHESTIYFISPRMMEVFTRFMWNALDSNDVVVVFSLQSTPIIN